MTLKTPFYNQDVQNIIENYPPQIRKRILKIRELIFETAQKNKDIGKVEETLKWGEPSYLPLKPKTGTTIRLNQIKNDSQKYAIYFHCQTNLIETFKSLHGEIFQYEGKRALVFDVKDKLPKAELQHCFYLALTYHLKK